MFRFEFEKDSALRGYWVKGLKELQPLAVNAMLNKEECEKQIFIPDSLLRMLGQKELKK